MKEMKTLKSVSKNLKNKEYEIETLLENLQKSKEENHEFKARFESSENLLISIMRNCINNDNDSLTKLYTNIENPLIKYKQKRNSLLIDDLIYKSDIVKGFKTTREHKVKSPYSSQSSLHILTTPKLKKISVFTGTRFMHKSINDLDDKKPSMDDNLQQIFNRVKETLDFLNKTKKK